MTEGGGGGPGAAQTVFQDPQYNQQLLDLHRKNTPFVEMANAVGVKLSPEFEKLVTGMSDAEVKIIRDAMIQALERHDPIMPFHCQLQAVPPSISVTAVGSADSLLARIDPST
ncbi:MAG TPA: hypothetical protein VH914_13000 [Acidimicrobiia bacterium]|jgi:hypothetical protein|nr:hypothetical protein [Acidimicrobiia bacterium]